MSATTDAWTLLAIAGLAAVTVATRCFFFILDRAWSLPPWTHRALQYAPVAALAGVVVPEVVMANGHLVPTWQDARLSPLWESVVAFNQPPAAQEPLFWQWSAMRPLISPACASANSLCNSTRVTRATLTRRPRPISTLR